MEYFATHMSKQVLPHAPSPTMTNLRRISAICAVVSMTFQYASVRRDDGDEGVSQQGVLD
jgi:hypothetical protein